MMSDAYSCSTRYIGIIICSLIFFIASTRSVAKQRNPDTGKTKKKYDKARTPYERVIEQMKDGVRKRNLIALKESLDPIELQEKIQKSLKRLFNHMKPESIL